MWCIVDMCCLAMPCNAIIVYMVQYYCLNNNFQSLCIVINIICTSRCNRVPIKRAVRTLGAPQFQTSGKAIYLFTETITIRCILILIYNKIKNPGANLNLIIIIIISHEQNIYYIQYYILLKCIINEIL